MIDDICAFVNITPEQLIHALSDQTRLRSVFLLQQQGELCVCELMYALDSIQPKVSRHLALLRDINLVSSRRQGQWIYYQLHADLPHWATDLIDAAQSGSNNLEPYTNDLMTLNAMPNRPTSACIA